MRYGRKISVVTGASSGMGREIVNLFVREGAKVVAVAARERLVGAGRVAARRARQSGALSRRTCRSGMSARA
jgi:NAD(P)-dependent dehydrogenase (short-subunit alcohol dehydrogenase family)